ncbi:MAG: N-acetyl-gamma-glutamyl-phosphate reductase [Cyclobacteriaceae bacterium]
MKINVGIVGAGGYTAGELLRLLIHHPNVGAVKMQSESQASKPVTDTHKDLIGECDLVFMESLDDNDVDVIFLCKGHGQSEKVLADHPEYLGKIVIDLSQDYRLAGDHSFVYGLPEFNRTAIKSTQLLANPGCFATSIQLGILPAVAGGFVEGDIHISGITGSTGAGQSLSATSHYSWRNANASVYKAFQHQHLNEIGESCLTVNNEFVSEMRFIPYRGAFTRGIITTSYFKTSKSAAELQSQYERFYADHPFTHVSSINPDVKLVVNTNKCLVFVDKIGDQAMAISVIDNLLKGASGQAVQNMNLMLGFDEQTGLGLKGTGF